MSIHRFGEKADKKVLDLMRTKGKHCDGGGLYLQVENVGQGSWMFRHKTRWGSIGPASVYRIDEAREVARHLRKEVHEGRDPYQMIASRRARPVGATFGEALAEYLKVKQPEWKASSRARELRDHERTFAGIPEFCALSIEAIDPAAKAAALAKLTKSGARKAKSWIGAVITFAQTGEYRKRNDDEVKHHASLPWDQVPASYARLGALGTVDARALQMAILTGGRTSEIIGLKERGEWSKLPATWGEIKGDVWVIGAERMKATKVHHVPLTPQMVALLGPRQADDVPLFKVSNQNAMLNTLKKNGGEAFTVHGMRSSFETWAAEQTNFPRSLIKLCTAHDDRTATDEAYQRSGLIAKRREVLTAWSDFVTTEKTQ